VWKTTGKDSSEACPIACQNCAVYSVFPSGMTSQSNIAEFNWDVQQHWPSAYFSACPRCMPERQANSRHWNPSVKSAIMEPSSSQHSKLVTNSPIIQRILVHSTLIQTQRPWGLIKYTVTFIFCQRCSPHCLSCKAFLSGIQYNSALDLWQYERHIL